MSSGLSLVIVMVLWPVEKTGTRMLMGLGATSTWPTTVVASSVLLAVSGSSSVPVTEPWLV